MFPLQVMEQLPSIHESKHQMSERKLWSNGSNVRKDQVQLLLGLEAELQGSNERAIHPSKHEALSKGMRNLVAVHNVRFADGLQRVNALRVALADLHHLAEAALANDGDQLKVVDPKCLALQCDNG